MNHKGSFWHDGHVFFLDRGVSYTEVWSYQKSLNCTHQNLEIVLLYVYYVFLKSRQSFKKYCAVQNIQFIGNKNNFKYLWDLKCDFLARRQKRFAELGMGCRKCTALEPNHSTVMPMALQEISEQNTLWHQKSIANILTDIFL